MYDPVELKLWSWSALVFWMEMAYPVEDEGGDNGYMDGREKDWRRALGCFVWPVAGGRDGWSNVRIGSAEDIVAGG